MIEAQTYPYPLHSDPETAKVKGELIRLLPERLLKAQIVRRAEVGGLEHMEVHLLVEPYL